MSKLVDVIESTKAQIEGKKFFSSESRDLLRKTADKIRELKKLRAHTNRTSTFSTQVIDKEIRKLKGLVTRLIEQKHEQTKDIAPLYQLLKQLESIAPAIETMESAGE